MTELQNPKPQPQSENAFRCCFCYLEIALGGPQGSSSDDPHRLTSLYFAAGPVAGALGAREQSFYCHYECFSERLHEAHALSTFDPEPETVTEDAIRADCSDLSYDLLIQSENLPFRDRLFASPAGRWISVAELAADLEPVLTRLSAVAALSTEGGVLLVQHTPDPLDEDGPFALIIFALPYYLWMTSAHHRRGF